MIRELRESVRRDLETLLNTRVPCVGKPKEWIASQSSIINYGIPDLSGLNLNSDDEDRKSTRLNSSHRCISYAVFCLKKKKNLYRLGVGLKVNRKLKEYKEDKSLVR